MRGTVIVCTGALVLSSTGLIIRSIESSGPWNILFARSVGLIIFLYLIQLYKSKTLHYFFISILKLSSKDLLYAIFLSLSFSFFIYALTLVTVAETSFIFSVLPILTALLAWLFLKEKIDTKTLLIMFIVVCGIALMVFDSLDNIGNFFGLFISFLAPLSFAIALIISRTKTKGNFFPAISLSGFLTLIIALVLSESTQNVFTSDGMYGLLSGIVLGAGVSLYFHAIKYISATHIALYVLLEIVLNPFWVWVVIGELPSLFAIIGGGIIIFSMICKTGIDIRSEAKLLKNKDF